MLVALRTAERFIVTRLDCIRNEIFVSSNFQFPASFRASINQHVFPHSPNNEVLFLRVHAGVLCVFVAINVAQAMSLFSKHRGVVRGIQSSRK